MENDQNPLLVYTSPSTMENDQSQLASDKGPSSLKSERYGHEGPSTGLSPLKPVRPENEGLSSFFEGLTDLDTKRPYIRTSFFEDLNTFEPDEPFQVQSDTAHQQVNSIIPERREEKKKETKKSKKKTKKLKTLKELYEQSK